MFIVVKSPYRTYGYSLRWTTDKPKPSWMISNHIYWYKYKRDAIKSANETNEDLLKQVAS